MQCDGVLRLRERRRKICGERERTREKLTSHTLIPPFRLSYPLGVLRGSMANAPTMANPAISGLRAAARGARQPRANRGGARCACLAAREDRRARGRGAAAAPAAHRRGARRRDPGDGRLPFVVGPALLRLHRRRRRRRPRLAGVRAADRRHVPLPGRRQSRARHAERLRPRPLPPPARRDRRIRRRGDGGDLVRHAGRLRLLRHPARHRRVERARPRLPLRTDRARRGGSGLRLLRPGAAVGAGLRCARRSGGSGSRR